MHGSKLGCYIIQLFSLGIINFVHVTFTILFSLHVKQATLYKKKT